MSKVIYVEPKNPKSIYVASRKAKILEFNKQGAPGIPGPPGVGTITMAAGYNLSGHRIVTINSEGAAIYADKDIHASLLNILGMTTGAVLAGENATIIPAGEIAEPSWTFDTSLPVYLNNNGLLTQALPTTGAIMQVGVPMSATKMLIDIKMPIIQI
jgi:hypothetical protein